MYRHQIDRTNITSKKQINHLQHIYIEYKSIVMLFLDKIFFHQQFYSDFSIKYQYFMQLYHD